MSKMQNYKTELKKLVQLGYEMMLDIAERSQTRKDRESKVRINFENNY